MSPAELSYYPEPTIVSLRPSVEILTKDPDLGLTILLWLADFLQEAFSKGTLSKLVVDDEERAGIPFRSGWLGGDGGRFEAMRDGKGTVRLVCSSSSVFYRRRPVIEAVRKMLSWAGVEACRDTSAIDHLQVVRRQHKIREVAHPVLGASKPQDKCRFLLRLDDFPSSSVGSEDFLKFHQVAREYNLPYLLGVTPFIDRDGGCNYLTDRELQILHKCSQEGAQFALHGFSHRSRYRNYASELLSMPIATLRKELDRAEEYLLRNGLKTIGFIAPFNSFDALSLSVLAERYPLLCGGPESVLSVGYRVGPSFLMQSIYVPSYRYVYDIDLRGLRHFDKLVGEAGGLIVPITLHWANEVRTDFRSFRALCLRMVKNTMAWEEFLSLANWVRSLPATGSDDDDPKLFTGYH